MSYYLFIFSSHQHVQHKTSQILLIFIDFDRVLTTKGGFPVIAETTRNHTFSKEISQVILAAMVLVPNFCCKICQRVISAMRGNLP